jgi:hypothetical protein
MTTLAFICRYCGLHWTEERDSPESKVHWASYPRATCPRCRTMAIAPSDEALPATEDL